MFGELKIRYPL